MALVHTCVCHARDYLGGFTEVGCRVHVSHVIVVDTDHQSVRFS